MRVNKTAHALLAHMGGYAGGMRVQQTMGFTDKMAQFAGEAERLASDIKALELVAPGQVPDQVVADTADKLADIAWAAILALTSMGLDAEQMLDLRQSAVLNGGVQAIPTKAYVEVARVMSATPLAAMMGSAYNRRR